MNGTLGNTLIDNSENLKIEKGSSSGKNDVFTVSKDFAKTHNFESELLRGNVKNGDIQSYTFADRGNVLIYTDNNTEIEKYQNIYSYLLEKKETLSNRNEVKKGCYSWFRFERPRDKTIFDAKEKIIVPYRGRVPEQALFYFCQLVHHIFYC